MRVGMSFNLSDEAREKFARDSLSSGLSQGRYLSFLINKAQGMKNPNLLKMTTEKGGLPSVFSKRRGTTTCPWVEEKEKAFVDTLAQRFNLSRGNLIEYLIRLA